MALWHGSKMDFADAAQRVLAEQGGGWIAVARHTGENVRTVRSRGNRLGIRIAPTPYVKVSRADFIALVGRVRAEGGTWRDVARQLGCSHKAARQRGMRLGASMRRDKQDRPDA